MGKMDEPIIVVKRAALFGADQKLTFQGTLQAVEKVQIIEQNLASSWQVMRRGDAEENPAYKQPITYAIIQRGNHFFSYKRLGGGAESRLHGKLSIGVGGHMNAVDEASDFQQILENNLKREISEELLIEQSGEKLSTRTVGYINDDKTEVGRVHIGILVLIQLPQQATVTVKEKDKLEGQWLTLSELKSESVFTHLESWSAYAAETLHEAELNR
ncbi:hypothetical protein [Sporolactobacillus spathodeae]|uniref:NUDIX family phosphoesterase n=1 Tax=Sporolactobacillus spathodeae TaxID=1465502 RepID=A0ABS2Q4M5_9BACL|nr:hypothetical protein [Sporolactobacillus spathodeae]MBM7656721.1 putative NUDIX family phosphoesterase [Sporolactobacillus spathodeae]